jgi:hypothetical protein
MLADGSESRPYPLTLNQVTHHIILHRLLGPIDIQGT